MPSYSMYLNAGHSSWEAGSSVTECDISNKFEAKLPGIQQAQ